VEGTLKTADTNYSKTPSAAPAPAPSTPSAPSGEYDDVPKTADMRFNPLWLVAMSVACFAGCYILKKED
jgi:3-oxoacyl-ACP reductase-like protein